VGLFGERSSCIWRRERPVNLAEIIGFFKRCFSLATFLISHGPPHGYFGDRRPAVLAAFFLWLWLTFTELPDADQFDERSCAWICLEP
jgi:hypothetical protein